MLDFLHQHTPSNFSDAIAIAVYLGKTRGVTEDDLEQQAWDKMRVFKSPDVGANYLVEVVAQSIATSLREVDPYQYLDLPIAYKANAEASWITLDDNEIIGMDLSSFKVLLTELVNEKQELASDFDDDELLSSFLED